MDKQTHAGRTSNYKIIPNRTITYFIKPNWPQKKGLVVAHFNRLVILRVYGKQSKIKAIIVQ